MLLRLQTLNTRFAERVSITSTLALTWGTVLVLLLAYLPDRHSTKLIAGLVYLVIAIAGIVIGWMQPEEMAHRWRFLGAGIAASVGLVLLPASGAWTWWVALVGSSLLVGFAGLSHLKENIRVTLIYALLTAAAAVIGAVLSGTLTSQWDTFILGLGTLILGQVVILGQVYSRQVATESGSEASASALEHPVPLQDLAELSTRIHVTVDGLVRSAQAINEVTTQQADGASEQVDVIKLTNDMMDSFIKLSEHVSEQTRSMTQTAQETAELSEEGQAAIRQAITGMGQIRHQVTEIGTTIVTLAQLTRRIDEIITSVSEIATQSNLLALNASIEAARAGAQGRGFAVVADEVRSLSLQSTSAARQVRAILSEIQTAVKQTISATESGMHGVDAGMSLTQQADQIMMNLAQNVDTSNQSVRAIYEVIRQQAEGLEEIAISMERIDRITQQNLASTRMVATVSTNLNRLADDLQEAINTGQQTAVGLAAHPEQV